MEQAGQSGVQASDFLKKATIPGEAERERLLSFMIHELRNPLASALWSAEMLSRQALQDPRHQRMADLAARSVRRLRTLIEDLFAVERLPVSPSAERVELRTVIGRALQPTELDSSGIEATISGPSVTVAVDPVVLEKAVRSCLRRLAHVRASGPLSIEIERQDGAIDLLMRSSSELRDVDPPLLTSDGSEGAGTTFALIYARVAAPRLGLQFDAYSDGEGTVLRLQFPQRVIAQS